MELVADLADHQFSLSQEIKDAFALAVKSTDAKKKDTVECFLRTTLNNPTSSRAIQYGVVCRISEKFIRRQCDFGYRVNRR
uniref:Transcriptional regulator n=1 Tax=Syphacia muris TaxID=451379 RepID=A0A0N5ARI1_9BILA